LDDRVADCPKRKNGIMSSIIFFIVEVNKRLSKSFSFDWGQVILKKIIYLKK